MDKKFDTIEEAIKYATAYCSRQERALKDVKDKLVQGGLTDKQIKQVLQKLIREDYINEQRYADLYARSKVNQSKWGKIKIKRMLIAKGISISCINEALSKIDEKKYLQVVRELYERKINTIKVSDPYQKEYRIRYFLSSHGFENEIIDNLIKGND